MKTWGRASIVALLIAAAAGRGRAEPPLVVYHAPQGAPREVAAAREALAREARGAGAAFIDLSPAPPPAPTAPSLLARGLEAYDAVRYDEALTALDAAFAEAQRTGAAGLGDRELSDLLFHRGLIRINKGDEARAWDDLVRAAVVDPARILDPRRFPPKTVAVFQRAQREVAAAPRGRIVVDAPAGCAAWIDARPMAFDPPELPYGEHYLRLECPGAHATGGVVTLAQATLRSAPRVAPVAAPDAAAARALGRERGAAAVLLCDVRVAGPAPPTLVMRLLDVGSDATLAQRNLVLAPDVAVDASLLVARDAPRAAAPAPRPQRWYQKPWLWAVVGAAAATAIALPLAIDRAEPDRFGLRVDWP